MKTSKMSLTILISVFISGFISLPLAAQADSLINLPNLLLPRFTKSVVKMKSGDIKTAVLNYNTVDQEMVFMQDKLFLVLDEPQLIDSVFMANRTFVPMEKGFYEVIYKAPVALFKQHKSYVEHKGYPTLYGARSQTTSPSYVRQIYGGNGAIDLHIPPDFDVVDDSKYWLRMNYQLKTFENKRNFLRIFPEHEKELNTFINRNNTDFKKMEDVIKLIEYCNSIMM